MTDTDRNTLLNATLDKHAMSKHKIVYFQVENIYEEWTCKINPKYIEHVCLNVSRTCSDPSSYQYYAGNTTISFAVTVDGGSVLPGLETGAMYNIVCVASDKTTHIKYTIENVMLMDDSGNVVQFSGRTHQLARYKLAKLTDQQLSELTGETLTIVPRQINLLGFNPRGYNGQ